MRILLAILLLMTNIAHGQENSPEVDEGIASIKQRTFDFSTEARAYQSSPEFIFKHKEFSLDWIHAEGSEEFFKLKYDREIFSLMGTGLEWNVALNALDNRKVFYVLPSVGVNLYMRIRPRLGIYTKFSGLTLGNRGHVSDFESGIKYSPQKNFSISLGWRRINFKLRCDSSSGSFNRNGLFAGVRYDF